MRSPDEEVALLEPRGERLSAASSWSKMVLSFSVLLGDGVCQVGVSKLRCSTTLVAEVFPYMGDFGARYPNWSSLLGPTSMEAESPSTTGTSGQVEGVRAGERSHQAIDPADPCGTADLLRDALQEPGHLTTVGRTRDHARAARVSSG